MAKPELLLDGLRMYLDAAEWPQLEILVKGSTEPATLRLIKNLLTRGDCVIDVGAHIGLHALTAGRSVGAEGRVYAFDPQPYNADRIGRNAAVNGLASVVPVCAAVGTINGFVSVPIQSDRDRSRLSLHEHGPNDLAVMVEVPIRRLDSFMAARQVGCIKLLKIDVEGYELEVLRGLGSRIGSCENIILEMLESGDRLRAREVVELLTAAGFSLYTIEGHAWLPDVRLLENNIWAARADQTDPSHRQVLGQQHQ